MITFSLRHDLGAAHFVVTDLFTLDEYFSAMKEFLAWEHFRPGLTAIWDFRDATGGHLRSADIRAVAAYNESIALKRGPTWSVAIVVATDVDFGLSRMFEAYTTFTDIHIGVFRSLEEAEEWVRAGG